MKKIVNAKKYDTETATKLGSWSNGYTYNDFHYCEETLYRKKTGEYFLYGEGGARTKYRKRVESQRWSGGWDIYPMTEDEARTWTMDHLECDVLESIFEEVNK